MIETTEVRWFGDGMLPEAMVSWFTVEETRGAVEERTDLYALNGRCEVGVKFRSLETLELKVRRAVAVRRIADTVSGQIEVWHKWSPADGLVDSDEAERWEEVRKSIVRRRFSPTGAEVWLGDGERSMSGAGCDVEIVSVEFAGIVAWTFALAAYGPLRGRRTIMHAAWDALLAAGPRPEWVPLDRQLSYGYPEWLVRRTDRCSAV